jgi:hypothetical protein
MNKTEIVMIIKKSAMMETLEELGDVMADNNILISIQNDEDFDIFINSTNKEIQQ